MTRFVIYLFETGLCLSLLYLAYWLFLRKETYFNFNRLFLVCSIILSLTLPLVHLNFMIRQESSMEESAAGILKFRNYYQELIGMIDADYGSEPGVRHSSEVQGGADGAFEGMEGLGEESVLRIESEDEPVATRDARSRWHFPALVLLLVYLAGVAWFLVRFHLPGHPPFLTCQKVWIYQFFGIPDGQPGRGYFPLFFFPVPVYQ